MLVFWQPQTLFYCKLGQDEDLKVEIIEISAFMFLKKAIFSY